MDDTGSLRVKLLKKFLYVTAAAHEEEPESEIRAFDLLTH